MIFTEEHKREHIKELQRLLYEISCCNVNISMVIPDGIYGSETREAVSAFQREYGIPETGDTDPDTWDKIVEINRLLCPEILSPDIFRRDTRLIPGSTGAAVYLAQFMLNTIGSKFYNIPVIELNGIYDDITADSVNAFKCAAGAQDTPDGISAGLWNILVSKFNKTAL